jgi:hypothetical protein
MKQSNLFSLNWRDALNGFVVTAITSVVTTIGQSFESGNLPTLPQLKTAGVVGLAAGFSYIVKNFFSKPTVQQ